MNRLKSMLPNLLTCFRIIVAPILPISLYYMATESSFVGAIIFSLACLTDFLDGYLARHWRVQSRIGALLDHTADKIIVCLTIISLIHCKRMAGLLIIPSSIIIVREIAISGLREHMATLNCRIKVSKIGKVKTATQMFALLFLIIDIRREFNLLGEIGEILLWTSSTLSSLSAINYVIESVKVRRRHTNSKRRGMRKKNTADNSDKNNSPKMGIQPIDP